MHKHRIMLFRVIVLSLILNLFLIGGTACERLAPIQIENKTSEILTVYIDEYRIGDVKPNDKIKNDVVWSGHDWYLIEAHDIQGNVVFSQKFSFDEMIEKKWKIVISQLQSM